MSGLSQPGSRGENIVAGTFLVGLGVVSAILGLTQLFSGGYLLGTGCFALGCLMLVLAWRGHNNFRDYLEGQARNEVTRSLRRPR